LFNVILSIIFLTNEEKDIKMSLSLEEVEVIEYIKSKIDEDDLLLVFNRNDEIIVTNK
jgi:hypothetical protein